MNMLELAEATGFSHAAVSKKLAASELEPIAGAAKSKVYDAPAALRVLLCGDELDGKRERARLDAATADLRELELARKRGELVPRGEHEELGYGLVSLMLARTEGVPARAAPEARLAASDPEAAAAIEKYFDEARVALAQKGDEIFARAEASTTEHDDAIEQSISALVERIEYHLEAAVPFDLLARAAREAEGEIAGGQAIERLLLERLPEIRRRVIAFTKRRVQIDTKKDSE